ncbi:MAG TPA: hypothetical protein VGM90_30700 [Kofleriaceae bacterium]
MAPSCYDAEDLRSGDLVRIELAGEEDSALIDVRFSRAATQLQLIEHPCISAVIDHGLLANGRPWVASARHPGTPLSDVLAERKLKHHETVALVYSVANVLAHAHHGRIVHGSLRPHHLTLSKGARVSISGWAWLRSWGIPAFGDPVSTSVFNPPEHDGTSAIDGRADVYALGAIAYRALTGVFPDVSRDLIDNTEPLGEAIDKMLALDVRDRASASEIVADLAPLRERRRAQSQAEKKLVAVSAAVLDATEKVTALAETERTDLDPTALNISAVAPDLEPTDLEALEKTSMLDMNESKAARGSDRLFGGVAGPAALRTITDVEALPAPDQDATRVVHMTDVNSR